MNAEAEKAFEKMKKNPILITRRELFIIINGLKEDIERLESMFEE